MNSMIAQIHSLPGMIREIYQPFDSAAREALDHKLCLSAKRIYITGCGDSHHTALGAELAFEHLAGVPTEALTSMQFARYAAPTLPRTEPGTNVVMGISVSGEVSRTLEALQQAKANGAATVALTATPGSRIFNAADHIYNTVTPDSPAPEGANIPGVRSYVANQLALYLAAIRIGEVRGRLTTSEANAYRKEVLALADAVERTIAASDAPAKGLASDWADASEFVFVGAGPNFASALFSAAKILEASGDAAMGQDTEEFGHLQYFAKAVKTPTFIISDGGVELSRANEIATAAKTIGRRVVAVAPASATFLHQTADRSLPLAEGVREMFSPIVAIVPGALFAAYRSDVVHEPFFRDFGGGRSTEGGGGISRIRTSELLETH